MSTEWNYAIPSTCAERSLGWDVHLARWISNVLSPPVVTLVGTLLAALAINSAAGWRWSMYYLLLTWLAPMVYLGWKWRRGEVSDLHVTVRQQRIRPLSLTLACAAIALVSLWKGYAPTSLRALNLVIVLITGIQLLITLAWKISGHGLAIGSMAIFLWGLYGAAMAPALLLVPLVGWARVRIHHHTTAQVVAGSLAGITVALTVVRWMSPMVP